VDKPYYADDLVSLYLGDCREVTAWLEADVLVTDPPYGRGWRQGGGLRSSRGRPSVSNSRDGITGDLDTSIRDDALGLWGDGRAIVFGDLMLPPPSGTRQVLPYLKAQDAGARGATAGFRRDAEAVYLIGPWPSGIGGRSSLLATAASIQGGEHGVAARYGHPHAKPLDVMEMLIAVCAPGIIADPFAGSGSTLMAARNLGRRAIGVELDEPYAEQAARRLSQTVLEAGHG
jgi:hypothetical protein